MRCFASLATLIATVALPAFGQHSNQGASPPKNDWTIVPCERFGPITPATDIADLPGLFGKENVRLTKRPGPEGEGEVEIVLVYPETDNQIEIQFNPETGGKIVSAMVKGGEWRLSNGLAIGSTLGDLEKLNEKPVTFLGLDWDYGGTVTSYNDGKLDPIFSGDCQIGLQLRFDGKSTPQELIGDQEIRSDSDKLPKEKLKISSIHSYFQSERE